MGPLGWLLYFGAVVVAGALIAQVPFVGRPLAVLIVVAAVWFYRHYKKPTPAARPTPSSGRSSGATANPAPTESVLASTNRSVRLFSQGRQSVAGEYYRANDLARVVGRRRTGTVGDWDGGLRETALLEREPRNKHDPNAVRVRMAVGEQWLTVGYLPRDDAARWQPTLRELESTGLVASCLACIYQAGRGDGHQVVLRLSEPERAVPGNSAPVGAILLEAERECAVTGEQHFQDALLERGGWIGPVWATLHPGIVPTGNQSGAPTVEAHIDGKVVGTMTAAQGARYGALLNRGTVIACEAEIFAGPRYREVRLSLPKVD
ncbi:HIRAN domain-containing protein [Cellulomonas sp. WB94]|uniref:HIRAN domain-containing protein n=1 Tax=Cellulomonas sp. WB94 TaxID=2173174 RepID=UPI00130482C4|nr:HIRAN domain-containing protein [Cellulomonas sp. WB94]